jgi:hypothetical protein
MAQQHISLAFHILLLNLLPFGTYSFTANLQLFFDVFCCFLPSPKAQHTMGLLLQIGINL